MSLKKQKALIMNLCSHYCFILLWSFLWKTLENDNIRTVSLPIQMPDFYHSNSFVYNANPWELKNPSIQSKYHLCFIIYSQCSSLLLTHSHSNFWSCRINISGHTQLAWLVITTWKWGGLTSDSIFAVWTLIPSKMLTGSSSKLKF